MDALRKETRRNVVRGIAAVAVSLTLPSPSFAHGWRRFLLRLFGAKTALNILKASGQSVRDAESERAALMTQAQDQIADLSLAGPPEDSPSSSSSQ